jgi:DNA-binding NarL/FixJ family response regulator
MMSTQSNLISLHTSNPTRIGNQKIFEYQRRFSAMTRGLTPSQIDQLFDNMQVFIASSCTQGQDQSVSARTDNADRGTAKMEKNTVRRGSSSIQANAPVTVKPAPARPRLQTEANDLSKREQEVLVLLSNGYSRREIGDALGISVNTAARHISNIYRKLGITSVAEATRYALSHTSVQPIL